MYTQQTEANKASLLEAYQKLDEFDVEGSVSYMRDDINVTIWG